MHVIPFSNDWEFSPEWSETFCRGEGKAQAVRLPHTVRELPLHAVDEKDYQMICGYRRRFALPEGKRRRDVPHFVHLCAGGLRHAAARVGG